MSHVSARALLAALVVIGVAFTAQAQTVKKWVDENGVVHYGDRPPPSAKKTEAVRIHQDINVLQGMDEGAIAAVRTERSCKKPEYDEKRAQLMNEVEALRIRDFYFESERNSKIKQVRSQIDLLDRGYALCAKPGAVSDIDKDRRIQQLESELASARRKAKRPGLVTYSRMGNSLMGSDGSSCGYMGQSLVCSGGGISGTRTCSPMGDSIVCY